MFSSFFLKKMTKGFGIVIYFTYICINNVSNELFYYYLLRGERSILGEG